MRDLNQTDGKTSQGQDRRARVYGGRTGPSITSPPGACSSFSFQPPSFVPISKQSSQSMSVAELRRKLTIVGDGSVSPPNAAQSSHGPALKLTPPRTVRKDVSSRRFQVRQVSERESEPPVTVLAPRPAG